MAAIPAAIDVINFLESYDLQITKTVNTETVTGHHADNTIVIGGGVGYVDGDMVVFTGSDIPAPLVAGNTYYVVAVDSTHISIALTYQQAILNEIITLADSGSGTIVMTKKDYYFISLEWLRKRMTGFIIPYVERTTGIPVGREQSFVEYYSGNGRNAMVLNRRPIKEITEIRYVLGGNNLTILNLGNIEVVSAEGILKAKRNYEEAYYLPVFAKGDYNIKVTGTYGSTDVPDEIVEAILYLTAEQALGFIGQRTGGGNTGGQVSKSFGNRDMYTTIRDDLARWAYAILNKYGSGIVGA